MTYNEALYELATLCGEHKVLICMDRNHHVAKINVWDDSDARIYKLSILGGGTARCRGTELYSIPPDALTWSAWDEEAIKIVKDLMPVILRRIGDVDDAEEVNQLQRRYFYATNLLYQQYSLKKLGMYR